MEIGEQIRQWLIVHEYSIDFRDKGFIARTIKATRGEWEKFYGLLGVQGKDEYNKYEGYNATISNKSST